jgi:CBS domain containing-hemolysin-like protein
MSELVLLAISVLLIAACGIFVAAEFALIAVNRSTVERLAAKGDRKARGVLEALRSLSTQLSSAQVGITITNLTIGFLAEPAIAQLIEQPLASMGLPESAVPGIAIGIGIAIATVVTMIFGELVPKNLAIAKPLGTSKFIERPLLLFSRGMYLPIKVLNNSANFILRQFGVAPQEELASARSADELLSLVRRSAEKGTLAKETAQMLERSLTFGDLTALDVMTPRVNMKALQADDPVSEILRLAQLTGHSRFPVYDKDLDNIVGTVHIKYVIGVPRDRRNTTAVRNIMRPPVLVPSTIELEPLLKALRRGGLQMAVAIDEFGGTDGIVTMEDLLEELVGEMHDEHDRTRTLIRKRKDGSWMLSGLLRPDEIGEELDIFLPEEEEVETLGGLIVHKLERIPKVGDTTEFNAVNRDGDELEVHLKIERMDGNRIDRVRMTVAAPDDDSGEEE